MNRTEIKISHLPRLERNINILPLPRGERIEPGLSRTEGVRGAKRIFYLSLTLIFGLAMFGCAAPKEELHAHGDLAPVKTYPKDYIHPLNEINLEKVIDENKGLRVLEENATKVHDYYRGGVQEKAEGERFLKEGKLDEAMVRFEKSNRFLRVVIEYLSEDEASRNIYGDHVVIFLPNLLIADNDLKMIAILKRMGKDDKAVEARGHGEYYLERSLKSVKTEWAFQIKKEFQEALPKK